MKLLLTPQAREDIHQIRRYYKDYPKRLGTILARLDEGIKTLIQFPEAGVVITVTLEFSSLYRCFVIDKHYKLIYKVENNTIYIISVWDCRQDPFKISDRLQ